MTTALAGFCISDASICWIEETASHETDPDGLATSEDFFPAIEDFFPPMDKLQELNLGAYAFWYGHRGRDGLGFDEVARDQTPGGARDVELLVVGSLVRGMLRCRRLGV